MTTRPGLPDGSIERARSFLFVPGDDAGKLASANRSGADAVVADLEDAVAPAGKTEARSVTTRFASQRTGGPPLLVRVNAESSEFHESDIEAVRDLPLAGLVLPKAHADGLNALDTAGLAVVAMIEDAQGVRGAYQIALHPQVVRLALGGVDLSAELALRAHPLGLPLLHARSRLVIDSAAADVAAPIDTPYLHYRDDAGLRSECELVRSLGFSGKACIHPAQVEVVAAAFAPSLEEVEWATEIMETYERAARLGRGVTSHRGAMVDAPVVAKARALLEHATDKRTEQ